MVYIIWNLIDTGASFYKPSVKRFCFSFLLPLPAEHDEGCYWYSREYVAGEALFPELERVAINLCFYRYSRL